MRVTAAAAALTPRQGLVLAGVAAMCAICARRGDAGVVGSLGPPPRDKMNKLTLTVVEERLKLVKPTSAGDVTVVPFLKASYAIITIFDAIPGMGMVKSDMIGNTDKLWKCLRTGSETMQELCDGELEALDGNADKARAVEGSACNSALWLTRALRLIEGILKELVRSMEMSLKDCCLNAYARSLKRHHNMVLKRVFSVAVNAAPERAVFMSKLSPAPEADALKTMSKLLPAFSKTLNGIEGYLRKQGIER